jgi:phosphoesterase RecJ-like protein
LDSLGGIFSNNTDLFYRLPIVNFDSNPNNEHYGQINIIEITSVSTSENIFKTMNEINASLINEEIATALLAGIISQTRSFKTANITPNTLHTASQLMKLGADREKIIRHLYHNRSIASLKIWGQALSHLKNDTVSGLVWAVLTRENFVRSGATEEDLNELIDELIINSPEAKVIVLLYEHPHTTNQICGLIVSNEQCDAKMLVAQFNPQGNKKRASFTIKDKKLLEAETAVIEEIRKKIKETKN